MLQGCGRAGEAVLNDYQKEERMDHIMVEPADASRRDFARWCLAQEPRIETASARGFLVPIVLFAGVPDELLDGARIDGHVFRPVIEGLSPEGDGYTDEVAHEHAPDETGNVPTRRRRSRARKAVTAELEGAE